MDIKKALDQLGENIQMEAPPKKKKVVSEQVLQKLAEGRAIRMKMLREKKETIRQEKLAKGETVEYKKEGGSMKSKLSKLDKLDEILNKISTLENEKKSELKAEPKKEPVIQEIKQIEKEKPAVLEEEKPKELTQEKTKDIEQVKPDEVFKQKKLDQFNVKRISSIKDLRSGLNNDTKIIKPIMGKKNNPFLK